MFQGWTSYRSIIHRPSGINFMGFIMPLENRIIQGDCLEVMKDIPDKSIDMILADLPIDRRIVIGI